MDAEAASPAKIKQQHRDEHWPAAQRYNVQMFAPQRQAGRQIDPRAAGKIDGAALILRRRACVEGCAPAILVRARADQCERRANSFRHLRLRIRQLDLQIERHHFRQELHARAGDTDLERIG